MSHTSYDVNYSSSLTITKYCICQKTGEASWKSQAASHTILDFRFWSLGLIKCLQVMVFSKHLGCNHKTKLYSTIARLFYISAVCSQTLRLYSIAVTLFARILNTSSYKLFYFISLSIFLSCFKAGVTIATK